MNDNPKPNSTNGQSNLPNGNGSNGQAKLAAAQGGVALQSPNAESSVEKRPPQGNEMAPQNAFDQPIILQQPSYWSRAIMLTIMGVTSFSLLAAFIFKVEEAIPATGKLEPEGAVQEVQAPAGGVVEEILVDEGERVLEGETLIRLNPNVSEAELASLVAIYNSTGLENDFYKAELYDSQSLPTPERLAELEIPPFYANLTLELRELQQREAVFNNYMGYLDQLARQPVVPAYSGPLQELARAVWEQYSQVEQQIRGSALQLQQVQQRIGIEETRIQISQESQEIEEDIVGSISPLVEEGALARIQLQRQQSELLARQNELGARYSELENLVQQREALTADLLSAQDQQEGIVATARADARSQLNTIVDRKQQITSDLNNRIITNNNRLSELEAQIEQAQTQLDYQEIRSPIDGVVFDVQPQVQGVVNPNSVEPVLKVVPGDALVAQVFLTNQDVGFVLKAMEEITATDEYELRLITAASANELPATGNDLVVIANTNELYHVRIFDKSGEMVLDEGGVSFAANSTLADELKVAFGDEPLDAETKTQLIRKVSTELEYPLGVRVDVRIDSFPFNEFRDVKGEVIFVGDDALPPDQVYNFFRFPAKIHLDQQFIAVEGAPVRLQSGMSVNVNVKTRKRRIITLFTDLFARKVEKLRER